jgi:hypothetical protein
MLLSGWQFNYEYVSIRVIILHCIELTYLIDLTLNGWHDITEFVVISLPLLPQLLQLSLLASKTCVEQEPISTHYCSCLELLSFSFVLVKAWYDWESNYYLCVPVPPVCCKLLYLNMKLQSLRVLLRTSSSGVNWFV